MAKSSVSVTAAQSSRVRSVLNNPLAHESRGVCGAMPSHANRRGDAERFRGADERAFLGCV